MNWNLAYEETEIMNGACLCSERDDKLF